MSLRVLVVEDNPVNLELITEVLMQEGYQVFTAQSAEVGLRLAVAERPDLILMDMQLPDMTGYGHPPPQGQSSHGGHPRDSPHGLRDAGRRA